jgi:hypothetical protein
LGCHDTIELRFLRLERPLQLVDLLLLGFDLPLQVLRPNRCRRRAIGAPHDSQRQRE